jgi:methylenetetrahydrofolate reductase (NADPH)
MDSGRGVLELPAGTEAAAARAVPSDRHVLRKLLGHYSAEVVAKDQKGIEAVSAMPAGAEVFVANLPNESADQLIAACVQLARSGLKPVPHIVARNIRDRAELDNILSRLVREARVERLLILGGDRDQPVGDFDAGIQLIETGLLQQHGVKRIALPCHPEGHPRVPDAVIWPALGQKVEAAARAGLETYLVSQFAFDAAPFVAYARRLRQARINAPLRVGVAGPAKRSTLIRFAMMCGVGASLRALKERQELARNVLAGETPEGLLVDLAHAQALEPSLGIDSVHFFTFGSPGASIELAQGLRA